MVSLRREEQEISPGARADTARALAAIAQELSRITATLAACVEPNSSSAEKLKASGAALARISQQLENWGAQQIEGHRRARLRKSVLDVLRRGGPAFLVELAAATLSLPEEIRPVLEEMREEGLIEFRNIPGGQMIALTARGYQEGIRP